LIRNPQFIVHVTDETNVEKINLTASSLPSNESEISLAKLTPVESSKISIPGIYI
jgi:flavin reductase (DIM6/NTAB) family NADH-FMN oxidoreductase RutF